MTLSPSLDFELIYPDGDGQPMAESDPTRDYLIYGVEALRTYFQDRSDVYVSGNLFIYYRQGIPSAVIAPDVFVVFGVENKPRRSYKVWEEADRRPSFVLEITSKTTQEIDEAEKPHKYQRLGVLEYVQYDPTGDYLSPALKGSRLVNGQYRPMPHTARSDGLSLYSETLNLELRLQQRELRFYDSQGQKLLSPAETEQARQQAQHAQQQAEHAQQQAEHARQQAEQARQQAEHAQQQAEHAQQQAIPRLLAMGLTVEQVAEALSLSVADIESYGRH